MKVYIVDEAFRGQSFTNHTWMGESPITWIRDIEGDPDLIIYTDDTIWRGDKVGKIKIAWLFEGRTFKLSNYEYIERNHHEFDYIFTWDKELLDLNNTLNMEKFIFIPYGGSWINESENAIYEKHKNVSIVASNKKFLTGHYLRHDVIAKHKDKFDGIYGYGYNPVQSLLTAYKDYRFTVVIENEQRDYGFSEKIVTPMLCGTIPIYWGCPSVGSFFDKNGIISFDTIEELEGILNSLTEEKYLDMIQSVSNNFEIAKKFSLMENYVAEELTKILE